MNLTIDRLKELLKYDSKTGLFVWRVNRRGKAKVGSIAGRPDGSGSIQISIDSKRYHAGPLACFYKTGVWPIVKVDHKDLNRGNNKWRNLRQATVSQNSCNRTVQRNNKLGIKGVYLQKGKPRSSITINKTQVYLGSFNSIRKARAAYNKAARKYHGKYARVS